MPSLVLFVFHAERTSEIMKLRNDEMGEAIEALASAKETGKLGYAIARNLRKLKDEAKEYIDMRNNLMNKYGKQSEDGNRIFIPIADQAKYLKELSEISPIEHEVDIYTVPEELFLSGSLTSQQMSSLLWMIDTSKPEPKAQDKQKGSNE